MFYMLWILIALTIIVCFFSIQGIYAQEEGKPITCQENLAIKCSTICLEEFEDYDQEYRKCLYDCIDKEIDECPPLPPYELDFAQELPNLESSEQEKEGMTAEQAKALKESLERLEKEPKQPAIRGDLLLAIIIPLAIIGIVITAIIRMKKSR